MGCTTHHNACDCREAAIAAVLRRKDAEIERLKAEVEWINANREYWRRSAHLLEAARRQEGEGK